MFGFITGKIKTAVIVAASLAMPVVYLLGHLGGGRRVKEAVLRDELKAAKNRSAFNGAMREHEQTIQDNAPRSIGDLVERVRKTGL